MAKKRQTQGVPKKKVETQETPVESGSRFGLGKPLSEYRTRAEREAEIQRRIIWGVGAALIFVAVLIAVAIIYNEVIAPNRTVAEVNGVSISAEEFQNRVRFERLIFIEQINSAADVLMQTQGLSEADAANQAVQSDPVLSDKLPELTNNDQIGLRVLNEMIDDIIVRQEAEALGITVTQDDIDRQIEKLLGFDAEANTIALDPELTPEVEPTNTATPTPFVSPTPSPTPTLEPTAEGEATAEVTEEPTPLPTVSAAQTRTPELDKQVFENNIEAFYDRADREANYSRDDVNDYFEMQALREALANAVIEDVTTEEWVDARRIVVATEEEAQQVLESLNAGESFAELARAVSIDPASASRGGDMGLFPYNGVAPFTPDFLEQQIGVDRDYLAALETGQPGEIIGPVDAFLQDGTTGYQIIQIRSREDQDLNDDQIDLKRAAALEEYLEELRAGEAYEVSTSDDWPELVPFGPAYRPRSVG